MIVTVRLGKLPRHWRKVGCTTKIKQFRLDEWSNYQIKLYNDRPLCDKCRHESFQRSSTCLL